MTKREKFIEAAKNNGFSEAEIATFLQAQEAEREERILRYLSYIPVAGGALGLIGGAMVGPGGMPAGGAAGAGAGKALEIELGKLLGVREPNPEEELVSGASAFVTGGSLGALGDLLYAGVSPGKYFAPARERAISKTEATLPGSKLAEFQKSYAKSPSIPTSDYAEVQRLAEEGAKRWSGQTLSVPDILAQKSGAWTKGYGAGTAPRTPASAQFETATGQFLRKQLAEIAPSVSRVDQLEHTVRSLRGSLAKIAALGGTGWGLYKLANVIKGR